MVPVDDQRAAAMAALGGRLRTLRRSAGLNGGDLAAQAGGWHQSKVSRIENGKQLPSRADIDAWARICAAPADTVAALHRDLDALVTAHDDWQRRMRLGAAQVQLSYHELISGSARVRAFATVLVPGMLQTADYARAVFWDVLPFHGRPESDIEPAVDARMARQQLLHDGTGRQFEFLLCEPVLLWRLCDPDVMRGQLDRLQTAVGMRNVRLGVLPLNRRLRRAPQNTFLICDDLALVETVVGETRHHGDEAATYHRFMDDLWEDAVEGDEARQLIVQAANRLSGPIHPTRPP